MADGCCCPAAARTKPGPSRRASRGGFEWPRRGGAAHEGCSTCRGSSCEPQVEEADHKHGGCDEPPGCGADRPVVDHECLVVAVKGRCHGSVTRPTSGEDQHTVKASEREADQQQDDREQKGPEGRQRHIKHLPNPRSFVERRMFL